MKKKMFELLCMHDENVLKDQILSNGTKINIQVLF